MTDIFHKDLTGADVHSPGYVQSADPGAVGAGKYWVDTTEGTGKWVLKARNTANDGWEVVGSGGGGGESSKWEADGSGYIKPKDGDQVKVSHIDGALTSESDPVFIAHPAYDVTEDDITNIENLSGVNTGDETTESIKTKLGSATSLADGYLTATDWNTFDGKQAALGFTPENVTNKGQNNGYAGLDNGGKVALQNLPATLLKYMGVWNPVTNTPELTSPDTSKIGQVYNVSAVGSRFDYDWQLGDWAIYNESGVIELSKNSDDVVKVNNQTGTVELDLTDMFDVDSTNKATGKTLVVDGDGNHGYVDLGTSYLKLNQTSPQTLTASPIVNNLTAGRVPFASPTKTLTDDSNLVWDNTNKRLGIGVASPANKIDIEGNFGGDFGIRIKNATIVNGSSTIDLLTVDGRGALFKTGAGYQAYKTVKAKDLGFFNNTGNISILNDNANGNINFTSGGSSTPNLVVEANGSVGIGTVSPTEKLHVVGKGLFTQGIKSEGEILLNNNINLQGKDTSGGTLDILKVNTNNVVEPGTDFNFGLMEYATITEPISPDQESTYMYQEATGTRPNRTISLLIKNELGEKVIISTIIV